MDDSWALLPPQDPGLDLLFSERPSGLSGRERIGTSEVKSTL
jgi:hypothetical protein